jgi:hypothetical protein
VGNSICYVSCDVGTVSSLDKTSSRFHLFLDDHESMDGNVCIRFVRLVMYFHPMPFVYESLLLKR